MSKKSWKVQTLTALSLVVSPFLAQAETLTVYTGGSQNMVEYVTDYLGPIFEEQNPGITVRTVGTGPGDAGSQKIMQKIEAEKAAGKAQWNIDVIVANQSKTGEMVKKRLLRKYRSEFVYDTLATGESSRNALGTNVNGYVMPMFHSQVAIAYNKDVIANPPQSYKELKSWVRQNKGAFGYNGIKNGMSGLAFVAGWVYAHSDDAEQISKGPYDVSLKNTWKPIMQELKDFNRYISFTPGNAGTLDMLNRGEIFMGPVWVDMFYSWKAQGKVPPNVKLTLISPGLPGQPYYYAIPRKARNYELAKAFIALATSPKIQAQGIVKKFNWYPGIDAQHVKSSLKTAEWEKLFVEITPEDLAAKSKPFPLKPFFDDIKEAYEKQVDN